MKAREYEVMQHAVELGVSEGLRRFLKHREGEWIPKVDEHELMDRLADAIVGTVLEWFVLDDEPQE